LILKPLALFSIPADEVHLQFGRGISFAKQVLSLANLSEKEAAKERG